MKNLIKWFLNPPTDESAAIALLRLIAGGVFLSEGILKFVFAVQGVGRFTKLGLPAPELTANFVGMFEIVGGVLLIAGLLTRLVTVPFLIEMLVVILTTKVPLFLGTSPLPSPPIPPQAGLFAVLHEGRPDFAQILILIFLLIVGPGRLSVDGYLARRSMQERASLGPEMRQRRAAKQSLGAIT